MTRTEKLKHCRGCYCDDYNHGLGGAAQCWSLADAKLIWRKRVPMDQVPPWDQKAARFFNCRREQRAVFVKPEVTR
jgi:hypothetical protein